MATSTLKATNNFLSPFVIGSNTDLNDLDVPGVYECQNATTASSLTNSPSTAGFSMLVMRINNTNRNQLLLVGGSVFVRLKTSSGWSAWRKFTMD